MGICSGSGNENKNRIDGPKENPIEATNKDEIKVEIYPGGAKKIPKKNIDDAEKSICKIVFKNKEVGTGFFVWTPFNEAKSLITNYHVINRDIINKNIPITLEIHGKKIYRLNLANFNNNIQFFEKPDITVIPINSLEDLCQNITFLEVDMNYINGYNNYLKKDIFTLGYPNGEDIDFSQGKIINIIENEFYHDCDTDIGYSGSPILLSSDKRVIGIHKGGLPAKKVNIGTFIGTIFEKERNFKIINNNNEAFIPRPAKNLYSEPENKNNYMNIYFRLISGYEVVISISGNATVRTLFQKYMDKLNLLYDYSVHDLIFIYNAHTIDPFSDELIRNRFINGVRIVVAWKNDLTGGY